MSYFRLLGLDCEPFSTSPDPAFFYLSKPHAAAMYRLRTAVELRRGLSLVVGDIGTGKTTLARRLSQIFYEDPKIDFHVILNPLHNNDQEFLRNLLSAFHIDFDSSRGPVDCLQAIEQYLFKKGVQENKTIVLLIDEAQQLSHSSLEVLRLLLNYETNTHKLLQLILVGQMELVPKIREAANLWDRICLKLVIPPMDDAGMRAMIDYRLKQANYSKKEPLFSSGEGFLSSNSGAMSFPSFVDKIKFGEQGSGQISASVLWRVIFSVLIFIGFSSFLFMSVWKHQARAAANNHQVWQPPVAVEDPEDKRDKIGDFYPGLGPEDGKDESEPDIHYHPPADPDNSEAKP